MRNLPVHWHEGLFLRPQHFQAADRHWTEVLQTTEQWSHPYPYGLYELEYSDDALANHRFEIQRLRARMRDGTIVTLDLGQEPDDVGLKQDLGALKNALAGLEEAFEKETRVRVYLGIPKLHLGRDNVSHEHGGVDSRYLSAPIVIQDESAGGNDQEIELKTLNVRILLSTQDLSGFELLPIAQIKRAGEGEAVPQIDEAYIPPVMSIDAWNGLGRGIVRAAFDIIGQKVEVLSQQVTNRGIGLDSRHPGDLERIMMLGQLNAAYATLSVLAFARGVHPFIAYTELARIVGQLSIFTSARRVVDIPAYDHEDLARVFQQLKLAIETSIFSVRDFEYQQRFFVGVGMGMQVSLEPQWFHSDWQWFIGVHKADITEQEVRDLLSPGQLDWKLGSARQVELLFKRRAEGLVLRSVDRTIRALPSNQDWLYYEVARRDTPAWHDVQETQTLGMRLQDSMILNRDRLQGNRELAVNFNGRRVSLEFALFAVPPRDMTPRFALAVDPIFLHVLDLLERINRGEQPNAQEERLRIRTLIDQGEALLGAGEQWELAKYAIVSWIDEMLVDAPWDGREWWSNHVFEVEMFNTRLCNERFFTQAQVASSHTVRDALEVYYNCAVLGFHGLYSDPLLADSLTRAHGLPSDLEGWAKQAAMSIRLGQGRPPLAPQRREVAGAPPHRGRTRFLWSWLAVAMLLVIDVLLYARFIAE